MTKLNCTREGEVPEGAPCLTCLSFNTRTSCGHVSLQAQHGLVGKVPADRASGGREGVHAAKAEAPTATERAQGNHFTAAILTIGVGIPELC